MPGQGPNVKVVKQLLAQREGEKAAARDQQKRNQTASTVFHEGMKLYQAAATEKEYEAAANCFSTCITLNPSNSRFYFARGSCYKSLNDLQRALYDFGAAIDLDPQNAQYYSLRSQTLRKMNRLQEATTDLNKIVELEPNNYTHYFARASTFVDMEKYIEALPDFEAAIVSCTGGQRMMFKLYFGRARCLMKLKRYREAIADLRKALEFDQANASAASILGECFFELGDYSESVSWFSVALKLDATQPTYYNQRGLSLYLKGGEHLKAAFIDFNDAVKLDRSCAEYYHNRGRARVAICLQERTTGRGESAGGQDDGGEGNRKEMRNSRLLEPRERTYKPPADLDDEMVLDQVLRTSLTFEQLFEGGLRDLKRAIELEPKNPKFITGVARAYEDFGDFSLAMKEMEKALALDSKMIAPRKHLGKLALLKGLFELSIHHLSLVIQASGGKDAVVYQWRGRAYMALKLFEQAEEDLRHATELESQEGDHFYYLAVCCVETERYLEAISLLAIPLNLESDPPSAFDLRAKALRKLGRVEEAIADMTAALRLWPWNCIFYFNRGVSYLEREELTKAEKDLDKAMELDPKNARVLYYGGVVRIRERKFEESLRYLKQALDTPPPTDILEDLYYQLGLAYSACGHYNAAITALSRALNVFEAARHKQEEREREAVRELNKRDKDEKRKCSVVQLPAPLVNSTREVTYLMERAKSYQQAGMMEAATSDLTQVLRLNPYNAIAHFRRALAFTALKEAEKAAEDFEAARIRPAKSGALGQL